MSDDRVRLGVIGFGGFGMFAVQQYITVPGVKLVGMSGTHRDAAKRAAERFGVAEIEDVEEMLARDDINFVYIATPPFLHYEQTLLALKAGKNVIVEKPFAMRTEEADELVAEAKKRGLIAVANLMQRYNPLYEKIAQLIESKALGEVLHCYFENYATDEGLPPDHWFWDKSKSGGIFIEHGVHFFDMFEGWLGKGEIVCAQTSKRPSAPNIEDQVQCVARYRDGIHVNYYHGFTQASRMDRQEMRFLFERGDVTLYEWIPTQTRVHAIADESSMRKLTGIFEGTSISVETLYGAKERQVVARNKRFEVYQKFEMRYGFDHKKMNIYGDLVRALFVDQIEAVRDPGRSRKISEENGRDSLAMAVAADGMAAGG